MAKLRSLYQQNKTMELLGEQTILTLFYENKQALDDIRAAHESCSREGESDFNMLIDAFSYGVLVGKRIERAKKAKQR